MSENLKHNQASRGVHINEAASPSEIVNSVVFYYKIQFRY